MQQICRKRQPKNAQLRDDSSLQGSQTSKQYKVPDDKSNFGEVSKVFKDEQFKEEADCQLQLEVSYDDDDGDDGGGGFDDDDSDPDHDHHNKVKDTGINNVANSSKEDGAVELNQKVSPEKNTSATTTCASEVATNTAAKSAVVTTAKSKVATTTKSKVVKATKSKVSATKRPRVAAKTRSKVAASKRSKDAGTHSLQNKRHTRLSAGVIKAANYQSLFTGDKMDDDEEEEEEDEEDMEEEEHASDNNFDDSDGADDDIDISKYIIGKNDKTVVSSTESTPTDKDGDNSSKYGIEILDPALQKLIVPGEDPNKPFKCTLCDTDFQTAYLARTFQEHVSSDHVE
ncbi:uncharacterized protein [Amphiura filiformis]|uniref:uncharacterized protein n=1 Tax=Amphiura filiformis TaxID=82378 RepID=UPI003B21D67B